MEGESSHLHVASENKIFFWLFVHVIITQFQAHVGQQYRKEHGKQ